MDTGKIYNRMCVAAREELKPHIPVNSGGECPESDPIIWTGVDKKAVWLPRQDEIQKLLWEVQRKEVMAIVTADDELLIPDKERREDVAFVSSMLSNCKSMEEVFHITETIAGSMEQSWLMLYMLIAHKKVWIEENSVWTTEPQLFGR